MNALRFSLLPLVLTMLSAGLLSGQSVEPPPEMKRIPDLPAAPSGEQEPALAAEALPDEPAAPPADGPPPSQAPSATTIVQEIIPEGEAPPDEAIEVPLEAADAGPQSLEETEGGYLIKDAALNDLFQFLAKSANRQYFHNAKIDGPDFLVTGHLNDGNPLQQMEELAFQFGLSLHVKGNTIYALTNAQLSQLPSTEFHYQLRYLRPTDIEPIKELIKPLLSPGTGIVNFEPKTNTIIVIDTAHNIDRVRSILHGIDKQKGQIIVETKILRVNSSAAERVGVDWSSTLGETGSSVSLSANLNSLFGLRTATVKEDGDSGSLAGTDLVLSPFQISGVLRALADGNVAHQISNPTLITEDNEQATISIIDRIPIITTTITGAGGAGVQPTITEDVRYKIDESDKPITEDPENHREIGISLVVTPTLLPDGTVRMKMRPRSAQIVENVVSITGNTYPRVTESMIETLARVPDGYSLMVGGFYGELKNDKKNKIPLLGDIPLINFFFKSKEAQQEKTSLVFIVTPKSYNAQSSHSTHMASTRVRAGTTLDCDHDWVDPNNPGPAHEPNIQRTLRGMQPSQAPYYPRADELHPVPAHHDPHTKPRFSIGRRR